MHIRPSAARLLFALIAAFTLLLPSSAAFASSALLPPTTYLYVAPDGNDANYGNKPDKPLASLSGAERRLFTINPLGPVEIRMMAGVYDKQWVQRFGYSNGMPAIIRGYGGTAILDGNGAISWGLRIHPRTPGTRMNLTLQNVAVRNATNGLQIRDAQNVALLDFKANNIGNLNSPGGMGYAALSVYNSSSVVVHNPQFSLIENDASSAANMHAIYAHTNSQDLYVEGGHYRHISGDPIRIRNGSHRTTVVGGVFDNAGRYAILSDWRDPTGGDWRDPTGGEARSESGVIHHPTVISGYQGSRLRVGTVACFDGASQVTSVCDLRALS